MTQNYAESRQGSIHNKPSITLTLKRVGLTNTKEQTFQSPRVPYLYHTSTIKGSVEYLLHDIFVLFLAVELAKHIREPV